MIPDLAYQMLFWVSYSFIVEFLPYPFVFFLTHLYCSSRTSLLLLSISSSCGAQVSYQSMPGMKSSLLEETQEQEFQPKEGLSSSDHPLEQLLISTMSAPKCTVQNAQSHHTVPPPEGHFPALEKSPAGPHQDERVQTSHIIFHFTLHFDKAGRGWRKWRLVIAMRVYDSESQTDGLTSHHCTLHEAEWGVKHRSPICQTVP